MRSAFFEWDDDKAAQNQRKHGISFPEAIAIFNDPFADYVIDDRINYGETRINAVGATPSGTYIHVTFTERGDRLRLISARRAIKNEIARYHQRQT